MYLMWRVVVAHHFFVRMCGVCVCMLCVAWRIHNVLSGVMVELLLLELLFSSLQSCFRR